MRANSTPTKFRRVFSAVALGFLLAVRVWPGSQLLATDESDFEFTGTIQTLPNTAGFIGDWKVSGRVVRVISSTLLKQTDGQFAVGKFVRVEGLKQNNNSVIAQEVETKPNPGNSGTSIRFFGNIEELPPTTGRIGDWKVGGRTVRVSATTIIEQQDAPLAVGARVEVEGNQLSSGSVGATRVETESDPGNGPFDFTGTIESLPSTVGRLGEWAISGRRVNVTNGTRIRQEQGLIGVGIPVSARGNLRQNGSVDALEIETRMVAGTMSGRFLEFQGTIESLVQQNRQLTTWTVSGRKVSITPMTVIERSELGIAVGARVEVTGLTQSDVSINATRVEIKTSAGSSGAGILYGKTEMLPTALNLIGNWQVAGKTVRVTTATIIERKYDQLASGVYVEVFGTAQTDGSINASKIEAKQGLGNGAFMSFDPVATVSAASYRQENAPESIVSAFGSNLASGTTIATSQPLPLSLWNVSVLIDGRQARLFFVSPNQINYQIPADVPSGVANVMVSNEGQVVSQGTIQVANVAPNLFTADASGQGAPAGLLLRIKANGEQVYESLVRFDTTQNKLIPATIVRRAGEQFFLILFGSGLRNAPNSDGDNANGVAERVEAVVGGVNATVLYAGTAPGYVGLEQINIQIPDAAVANPNTNVTVRVRDVLNNLKQANSVTVSIQ